MLLGALQPAGQQSHRARSPVGGPDRVENGAPNALSGEAFERDPPVLVVATGRLHQAERSGPSQFLPVDVAGKVHSHLIDDMFHQRQVGLDPSVQLVLARP